MKPTADTFTELCSAALRGEVPRWPLDGGDDTVAAVLQHLGYHGVGPLICEALQSTPQCISWPQALCQAIGREYRALTALELSRRRELERVASALSEAQIRALLLKGAALAYDVYATPVLRTRTDTDILVRPEDKDAAGKVLLGLGYRKPPAIEGQYIKTQAQYLYEALQPRHTVDLHWRLTNSHVFSQTFHFGELWASAKPIANLPTGIQSVGNFHGLLHACAHRAINLPYGDGNRLIWLYDIHLLAERLTQEEWIRFTSTALEKRMSAVCTNAFQLVKARFDTSVPSDVMAVLQTEAGSNELSAKLLSAGPHRARLLSYWALASWPARIQMFKEQAFPSAEFVKTRYGAHGHWALAKAYTQRIVDGLRQTPTVD